MYGFVGFYAGGKTKGLYEAFQADLLTLGMETMNYLASVDYDRFVLRAKQWMDQAQTIYEDDPAIPEGKWKELQEFLESKRTMDARWRTGFFLQSNPIQDQAKSKTDQKTVPILL